MKKVTCAACGKAITPRPKMTYYQGPGGKSGSKGWLWDCDCDKTTAPRRDNGVGFSKIIHDDFMAFAECGAKNSPRGRG